jgi:hypothetical protein
MDYPRSFHVRRWSPAGAPVSSLRTPRLEVIRVEHLAVFVDDVQLAIRERDAVPNYRYGSPLTSASL